MEKTKIGWGSPVWKAWRKPVTQVPEWKICRGKYRQDIERRDLNGRSRWHSRGSLERHLLDAALFLRGWLRL
jgi:hypothetical protein